MIPNQTIGEGCAMRVTVTVVAARGGTREDAVIDAPGATPIGEVLGRLRDLVDEPPDTAPAIGGIAADAAIASAACTVTPLANSALRDGAIVSFGAPAGAIPNATYLEMRIVGGPAAGTIRPLATGSTSIGRGGTATIRIDDPAVSRRHAVFTVSATGVTVADSGSTNGSVLDGQRLTASPVAMRPGTRLRIGDSTVLVAIPDETPVAVTKTADGRLSFNRPPRLDASDPDAAPPTVIFPAEPVDRPLHGLPVIATAAPLVAGVVLAAVLRKPEYLLFTILSPLMMAGQWLSDRVGHRRTRRTEQASYAEALRHTHATLGWALAGEAVDRRRKAPDLATVVKIATGIGARLWERRRDDGDFLLVSLGNATLPADLVVTGAPIETVIAVNDVPATVSLPNVGVLGIAGAPATTSALTRAIISQLAVMHSPRDLGVVLMTEPPRVESWDWIRWLPHVRASSAGFAATQCQALLGLDADSAEARVTELATLIEARRGASSTGDQRVARPPAIVLVIDGAWALRRTRALAAVLSQGPAVGVYAVCIDEAAERLPEECGAVAVVNTLDAGRLHVQVPGRSAVVDIVVDGLSIACADRVARALAPIRDDSPDRSDALPDTVRWRDVADLGGDISEELAKRWRQAGAGSTRAFIGVGAQGRFAVDIARDGPHALIAGTTGSGKSELLQTLVASLAIGNRPDEVTFVLVDYKGGAAFGACAALPHTVGMVTDLDGRLVERALVSLGAELKRRESLLAEAGTPNIETFRADGRALARLVIVVDEFASLAEELPDFVGGLVGIAQRGRSLGVHLVLATQRPEGVVSPDIRANTNLRICLAVMRESESRDVIDSPEAARISRTTPGRGYARTGHGELHAFQCGRISSAHAAPAADADDIEVRLSPFRSLCRPAPRRRALDAEPREPAGTDLDSIVAACQAASARLGIETATSPWLSPLPEVVDSDVGDRVQPMRPLVATLAILDVPTRQSRERYLIDLDRTGHLIVAGSARSGRTTALRTLVGGLATSSSAGDLHLYAVDCAGGALGALAALPHCGGAITGHEHDRVRRLLSLLAGELVRRQDIFAAEGFGSLAEQRARPSGPAGPASAAASPLPHVVLLIDGWEAFNAAFEDVDAGAILDAAWRLLREGASVGIHLVVTADRAGLVGRLASTVEERLVLRLADRSDFSLIGLPARSVPTALPAGRGFLVDGLREAQVCVLGDDPGGPAQLVALATIAAAAHIRDRDLPRSAWPRRVDPLPVTVTLADVTARRPRAHDDHQHQPSARVILGVGGDELDAVSVDLLESGPGFLIAGPPRSGRSTALATVAAGLRAIGWQLLAVAPRPSLVDEYADRVFDASGVGLDAELGLLGDKVALLIDDAELVTDAPVAATLDRLMRSARDTGHVLVIAGLTETLSLGFRGFVVDARRGRAGVLLTPRAPLDGDVLGIRLPRSTGAPAPAPAGRGLLVVGGATTRLQVALPSAVHCGDRQPRTVTGCQPRTVTGCQPQTVTERVPIAAPSCVTVTLTTPSEEPVK